MASLIGFDPEELRRQQVNQGLIGAGAALMGQRGSRYPISPLAPFGDALAGFQQGQTQALSQYSDVLALEDAQRDRDEKRKRQEEMDKLIATLPQDVQQWAKANPDAFYKEYLDMQLSSGTEDEMSIGPPVYAKDKDGKLRAYQQSKKGGLKPLDLPDGLEFAPGLQYLDTGTGFTPVDKRGGPTTLPSVPKDLIGAERDKEIGAAEGKQIAAAPSDLSAAEIALSLVEDLRTDPNRTRGTGASAWGNMIPSTKGYDYQNKVDQAKSGAFLTAIQGLRGMGALSNAEGDTATKAVTRMNTATSEGAFLAALEDYERVVRLGYSKAQRRIEGSGGKVQMPPAYEGSNSEIDSLIDKYRTR